MHSTVEAGWSFHIKRRSVQNTPRLANLREECDIRLAGTIERDFGATLYRLAPTINYRAGGRSVPMLIIDIPAEDNLHGF